MFWGRCLRYKQIKCLYIQITLFSILSLSPKLQREEEHFITNKECKVSIIASIGIILLLIMALVSGSLNHGISPVTGIPLKDEALLLIFIFTAFLIVFIDGYFDNE